MKVFAQINTEVEVDVSLDDVMQELAALPTPEMGRQTLKLLSLCVGAVQRVPQACITAMQPNQREIVRAALATQLARFEEETSCEAPTLEVARDVG